MTFGTEKIVLYKRGSLYILKNLKYSVQPCHIGKRYDVTNIIVVEDSLVGEDSHLKNGF